MSSPSPFPQLTLITGAQVMSLFIFVGVAYGDA